MTRNATVTLAARPPFGGPQVVGYGYRWAVAPGGAVVLTRTANGRRATMRRHQPAPGNAPRADQRVVS